MNLQLLRVPQGFRVACYGCSTRIGECATVHADLDGPAYQAYYCMPCTQGLRARALAYQMADERDARIMAELTRAKLNRRGRLMMGSGLAGFQRDLAAT